MEKSKAMAPMTKEEWEQRQSVVRRVMDEETGRYRLSYLSDSKLTLMYYIKGIICKYNSRFMSNLTKTIAYVINKSKYIA